VVEGQGAEQGLSAAAEARALVARSSLGALATLSEDGSPWASLVAYGPLPDGSPVLVVSTLAEHGRNLERDPRASLVVGERTEGDPLDSGRVTLAGRCEAVTGAERDAALEAHCSAVPSARQYAAFADFAVRVLRVERVRWVGGFGRMQTVAAGDYRAASPPGG
jgi:putative heme iron utilization protein